MATTASNISVAVRIKPAPDESVFPSDDGQVVIRCRDASQGYAALDGFGEIICGSDQEAAYEAVAAPLVDQLLEGYSCALMAYGQTGSGKTHTIFGPPGVLTEAALRGEVDGLGGAYTAPVEWGLFPRIALDLLAAGTGTLHASAVEVYQERAYDLLADRAVLTVGAQKSGRQVSGGQAKDPNEKVPHKSTCTCRECYIAKEAEKKARAEGKSLPRAKVVARSFGEISGSKTNKSGGGGADESFATVGEKRVLLSAPADVARLARTIEQTRTAVGHKLNARSSRSHCLVHLHLTEKDGSSGVVTKRQMLVVDLAGSERILRSGAEGTAAAQAMAINTSLTALGKVVRALGAKASHVPYRDSTLTQLLRSSLAGRSSTSVVVAVASDACFVDESKVSLEFGQRLTAVKTRATVVRGVASVGDERASIVRALNGARTELADFEASGYGEKFGKGAQPGEIRVFKENTARVHELEASISHCKTELAESTERAKAAEGGQLTRDEVRELSLALREMSAELANLQSLIARQKAIPHFYIPARAVLIKKAAEVSALENKLEVLEQLEAGGGAGTDGGASRVDRRAPKRVAPVEAPAPAEAPAPSPWTAYPHPETGEIFYHNELTGESTFTPPMEHETPSPLAIS